MEQQTLRGIVEKRNFNQGLYLYFLIFLDLISYCSSADAWPWPASVVCYMTPFLESTDVEQWDGAGAMLGWDHTLLCVSTRSTCPEPSTLPGTCFLVTMPSSAVVFRLLLWLIRRGLTTDILLPSPLDACKACKFDSTRMMRFSLQM